jgi:hypothetical protein
MDLFKPPKRYRPYETMIIAYCFIGTLPDYAIHTVHQTRLFYQGELYFIVSDIESPLCRILEQTYQVTIVPYHTVLHAEFQECILAHHAKFTRVEGLVGRENLFLYAFERFFCLYHLMIQRTLSNVFFLELDNLIYNNPIEWETPLCEKEMAFMFDNYERCASGVCFLRTSRILADFMECCLRYIKETDTATHFMTEMQALHAFWKEQPDRVQILPTHWPATNVPAETYDNYSRYNSVFDSAGMGIYLGGVDPFHTNGMIITGLHSVWSVINYTNDEFKWEKDANGRMCPFVSNGIRINNLHIHSKNLVPYLSKGLIHNQS